MWVIGKRFGAGDIGNVIGKGGAVGERRVGLDWAKRAKGACEIRV